MFRDFGFSLYRSEGKYNFLKLFFYNIYRFDLLPEGHECLELFKKYFITSSIVESNSL